MDQCLSLLVNFIKDKVQGPVQEDPTANRLRWWMVTQPVVCKFDLDQLCPYQSRRATPSMGETPGLIQ